jgi:hypothetical protein
VNRSIKILATAVATSLVFVSSSLAAPNAAMTAREYAKDNGFDLSAPQRDRSTAKRSGTLCWDNGTFDGHNGLASELNTIVSDARSADDMQIGNTCETDHATAEILVTSNHSGNSTAEFYADTGAGPTNAAPFASFNSSDDLQIGSAFGLLNVEWEYDTTGLTLNPGSYWMTGILRGNGQNNDRGFASTSGFGGGITGQQGYFKSNFFGFPVWTPTQAVVGEPWDFAHRVFEGGGGTTGGTTTTTTTTTTTGGAPALSPFGLIILTGLVLTAAVGILIARRA